MAGKRAVVAPGKSPMPSAPDACHGHEGLHVSVSVQGYGVRHETQRHGKVVAR
jgi:hypothetical protein